MARTKGKLKKLRVIPLGGLGEIGKNLTVLEYSDNILIIDCGLGFPNDDMLGVDLVVNDITYLISNAEKIKGLVLTHGHEDHIGGIPFLLQKLSLPIYGTRLTLGILENKLAEHKLLGTVTAMDLLICDDDELLSDVMEENPIAVKTDNINRFIFIYPLNCINKTTQ